jgi:phosphatidylethanolamine/phosphatidyl-N-methylethanolamine N-methyltransferase
MDQRRSSVNWAAGQRLVNAAALSGAVTPSSQFLAHAMARAAHGAAALVELGAGTGSVTRALTRTYPGLRLVVVELRTDFALRLRREFKTAEVHAAPAAMVLRSLSGLPAATGIVSSLPFRSLPRLLKQETVCSILEFLCNGPGRFMVQFTYFPGTPFGAPIGFTWRKVAFVALNLPPAAVWVLQPDAGVVHPSQAVVGRRSRAT